MVTITPLLDASASCDDLAAELLAHLRTTGVSLPEDRDLLGHIATAVRYGRTRAVLAVQGGRAVGISAWHSENHVGYLSLLDVLPDAPPDVARDLLARAREGLQGQDAADGIYAELPETPPAVSQALHEMGFVSAKRLIMRAELVEPQPPVILPPGCHLTPWRGDDFASAAEVIYRANVGTLDAQIIPELRALASTQRIVWQTLDGRYGWFDQQASGLALAADGEVVGVALVTRQEGNQGFTAEICVLPAHRRRGLARALMCRTHAVLMAHGLRECMLGVTGGNPARHLYESLGYAVIGSLWTYVWPKPDGWQGHEVGGSAPG